MEAARAKDAETNNNHHDNPVLQFSSETDSEANNEKMNGKKKRTEKREKAKKEGEPTLLDKICRPLMPFLYVVFLIIYFAYYLSFYHGSNHHDED